MFEAVVKGIRLNSKEGKKKRILSLFQAKLLVNETIGLIRFEPELTNLSFHDSLEFIEKLFKNNVIECSVDTFVIF